MKGKILKALREADGYLSGELLSNQLGISRVAIWKQIHGLKRDGYKVDASQKGYRLDFSPDLLLPCEFPDLEQRIHHFLRLSSTMDKARELARKGVEEGTIVIAEEQVQGRGRLGREWISTSGGIYFTLTLRPKINPAYAPRLNLMASIAVANTIRELFDLKAELKWPNDVLMGNKKVCGIFAEIDAETDIINFVNIGIGINANNSIPGFEKTAISLKELLGREISRKIFFSSLLMEIDRVRDSLTKADLIEEWKGLSATLNKYVRVVSQSEEIVGRAIDINNDGALMIKEKNGALKNVFAGDCIHLREEELLPDIQILENEEL